MGFDEKKIVVSDTQAYRQFGNAVVPKVVEAVGTQIMKIMFWKLSRQESLFRKAPQNSSRAWNAIMRGELSPPNPTPSSPVGGEVG